MNCEDSRKLISAHVDGDLPGDRQSDLEAHLRECSGCRREAEETRGVASLLTSALPSFSASLPDRIMATLPERTRPQVVALRWAAAAAAVIIPILLFLIFHESTDPGEAPVPVTAMVGEVEGVKLFLHRDSGARETRADWAEVYHGDLVTNTGAVVARLTLEEGAAMVAIDAGTQIQVRDDPDETIIGIHGDGKVLATLDSATLPNPFVVEATAGDSLVRVTALGTVFEVEKSGDRVEVRVHEGTVQVQDSEGNNDKIPAGRVWVNGDPGKVDIPAPTWTEPPIPPEALTAPPPPRKPDPDMDLPITPK